MEAAMVVKKRITEQQSNGQISANPQLIRHVAQPDLKKSRIVVAQAPRTSHYAGPRTTVPATQQMQRISSVQKSHLLTVPTQVASRQKTAQKNAAAPAASVVSSMTTEYRKLKTDLEWLKESNETQKRALKEAQRNASKEFHEFTAAKAESEERHCRVGEAQQLSSDCVGLTELIHGDQTGTLSMLHLARYDGEILQELSRNAIKSRKDALDCINAHIQAIKERLRKVEKHILDDEREQKRTQKECEEEIAQLEKNISNFEEKKKFDEEKQADLQNEIPKLDVEIQTVLKALEITVHDESRERSEVENLRGIVDRERKSNVDSIAQKVKEQKKIEDEWKLLESRSEKIGSQKASLESDRDKQEFEYKNKSAKFKEQTCDYSSKLKSLHKLIQELETSKGVNGKCLVDITEEIVVLEEDITTILDCTNENQQENNGLEKRIKEMKHSFECQQNRKELVLSQISSSQEQMRQFTMMCTDQVDDLNVELFRVNNELEKLKDKSKTYFVRSTIMESKRDELIRKFEELQSIFTEKQEVFSKATRDNQSSEKNAQQRLDEIKEQLLNAHHAESIFEDEMQALILSDEVLSNEITSLKDKGKHSVVLDQDQIELLPTEMIERLKNEAHSTEIKIPVVVDIRISDLNDKIELATAFAEAYRSKQSPKVEAEIQEICKKIKCDVQAIDAAQVQLKDVQDECDRCRDVFRLIQIASDHELESSQVEEENAQFDAEEKKRLTSMKSKQLTEMDEFGRPPLAKFANKEPTSKRSGFQPVSLQSKKPVLTSTVTSVTTNIFEAEIKKIDDKMNTEIDEYTVVSGKAAVSASNEAVHNVSIDTIFLEKTSDVTIKSDKGARRNVRKTLKNTSKVPRPHVILGEDEDDDTTSIPISKSHLASYGSSRRKPSLVPPDEKILRCIKESSPCHGRSRSRSPPVEPQKSSLPRVYKAKICNKKTTGSKAAAEFDWLFNDGDDGDNFSF